MVRLTLQLVKKNPGKESNLLEAFDKVWWPLHAICARDGK
jgi:hypothetical protein